MLTIFLSLPGIFTGIKSGAIAVSDLDKSLILARRSKDHCFDEQRFYATSAWPAYQCEEDAKPVLQEVRAALGRAMDEGRISFGIPYDNKHAWQQLQELLQSNGFNWAEPDPENTFCFQNAKRLVEYAAKTVRPRKPITVFIDGR